MLFPVFVTIGQCTVCFKMNLFFNYSSNMSVLICVNVNLFVRLWCVHNSLYSAADLHYWLDCRGWR